MPPKQDVHDAHTGGTLPEMAGGTAIPNDAGVQRTIPSVPRPDQRGENTQFDNQGIAKPNPAFAADNATDVPRSTRDMGLSGEVITGTGNTMGAQAESERTQIGASDPGAKGDVRALKHENVNRSAYDRGAKEDADSHDFIGENQVRNP